MIRNILMRNEPTLENLLKVLHEIQEEDPANHISHAAMREVSAWLKIPLSSVYGVLKYYSMFSTEPRGRHIIRICGSVVCMMNGGMQLKNLVEQEARGLVADESGDLPLYSVETTECLGHCEMAPSMMIDNQIMGGSDSSEVMRMLHAKEKEVGQ